MFISYYEKIGNEVKCIDSELPFEIPENWTWTTLAAISILITKGTTPRGGEVSYVAQGVGFLRAENIQGYDNLSIENLKYVDESTHLDFLRRSILQENDILITIAGTLGRTAIVPPKVLPLNANQAISIVRLLDCELIDPRYIIYSINAPTIKKELLHQEVAMAIPNLSLENISDCQIPVPPLAEQERIIDKIKEYFSILENIEASLN